jgi:hypothetical protein
VIKRADSPIRLCGIGAKDKGQTSQTQIKGLRVYPKNLGTTQSAVSFASILWPGEVWPESLFSVTPNPDGFPSKLNL